ncbi:DUF6670 family protein [Rhodococcus coprophilus]|uniref:Uncharacterized protein n=1 Tax=Rhodococcus coprophilus TaxID=38310 RepID=A0A2X4U889_9NOCA|nr:DUF6670 family protein [Rhodococcus coprophilus]MBM7461148.1 hypothetical protein [Rhodococcus coprophilus]SQI28950.1 Uncharacterised protein [Rhodococcus coprophilus]
MHRAASTVVQRLLRSALRIVDSAESSDGQPFSEPEILLPHMRSRRVGWTHYGVMIPDLPEPHRFFSMMSLVGATGSLAFDNDQALAASPRHNASLVAGTAASYPGHFGNYAFDDTFVAAPDGSALRFGDDLTLTGGYPHFRLEGRLGDVEITLRLTNTDKVSWFFRNPVYKHFGLLTEYAGAITHGGSTVDVEGLCSFEYGACPSPYLVRDAPLPASFKAPLDYFVYQIVNLDADNQILLSRYSIGGTPLMTTALHRSRDRYGTRFEDVSFEVLALRDAPEPTPYGIPMDVPSETRFLVAGADGRPWLDLHATMDTNFTFGLGSGFVTGFVYTAIWRGAEISGRGYFEFIDRRSADRQALRGRGHPAERPVPDTPRARRRAS